MGYQCYEDIKTQAVAWRAALAAVDSLAEARIAAPVALIGQDGAQESHARLSRLYRHW